MISPEILIFIFVLGLLTMLLFASILAFQGRRTEGSWFMLVGSACSVFCALGIISALKLSEHLWMKIYLGSSGGVRSPSQYEEIMQHLDSCDKIAALLLVFGGISLLAAGAGFVSVALHWIKIQRACIRLELEAKRLAQHRGMSVS